MVSSLLHIAWHLVMLTGMPVPAFGYIVHVYKNCNAHYTRAQKTKIQMSILLPVPAKFPKIKGIGQKSCPCPDISKCLMCPCPQILKRANARLPMPDKLVPVSITNDT